MNKFFHLTIRLALIFTVIFIALQTFNGFCKITQKCSPFYFSYYLHEEEGNNPYKVVFGIDNPNANLQFEAIEPSITTVANRNNVATYRIKNISNHFINFRIKLHVDPEIAKNDVIIYQCLCDSSYKLKKGEERILEMKFKIQGSRKRLDKTVMSRIFKKNNSVNSIGSQNRGMEKVTESPQKFQSEKDDTKKFNGTRLEDVPVLKIIYEVL